MITTRPDNWRDLRDDYTKTFITADKFEKLISNDNYFFFVEKLPNSPNTIKYRRVSKQYEEDSIDRQYRKTTHSIFVNINNESIVYEGLDSMWHEVYGPEGSYDKLAAILSSKTVEV